MTEIPDEWVEAVADALQARFAAVVQRPGVEMPRREIWVGYARAALSAALPLVCERAAVVAEGYEPCEWIGDTMRDEPESAEDAAQNIAAAIRKLGEPGDA